jgi:peptidoglycan hydrolase CwlO-like protein
MATIREAELIESWKELRSRPTISMNELDDLMYQIEKVFQNIRSAEESRDKWRTKFQDLKKEINKI